MIAMLATNMATLGLLLGIHLVSALVVYGVLRVVIGRRYRDASWRVHSWAALLWLFCSHFGLSCIVPDTWGIQHIILLLLVSAPAVIPIWEELRAEVAAVAHRAGRSEHRPKTDVTFFAGLCIISATYVVLLLGMLLADVVYMGESETIDVARPDQGAGAADVPAKPWAVLRPVLAMGRALADKNIQYAIKLTMVSCLISAILSLFVAVPVSYLLSRKDFPGKNLLDAILDIPIVLPPLVIGLSLLIMFQYWPFREFSREVVFQLPAVVLAQFMVAAAFAVRVMRATFDQVDTRLEQVALVLGCSQAQAFWKVVLPQAGQGMLTAGTLAWARSLGEFGPLLIFAGATRGKTEVLSTTVFLELSIGNLEAAVAVSLLMIMCAVTVLIIARVWGSRGLSL